jgi:hypothetical protein
VVSLLTTPFVPQGRATQIVRSIWRERSSQLTRTASISKRASIRSGLRQPVIV